MLEHMGRAEQNLIAFGNWVNFEEAITETTTSIYAKNEIRKNAGYKERSDETWVERLKGKASNVLAALLKVETIARRLDGFENGLVHKYVFMPLKRAEDKELRLLQEYNKRLSDLFAEVPKEIRGRWGQTVLVDGIGELSGEEVLCVALNSGNDGNRRTLNERPIKGDKGVWGEDGTEAVLNEVRPEEWTLVRGLWKLLDDLYPIINETHQAMFGLPLERVSGHYYPLVLDPKLDRKAKGMSQAEAEKDFWHSAWHQPATKRSFTHARQGTGRPVRLELGVIHEHIANVIHHSTHALAIRDVYKILNSERFSGAVTDTLGEAYYDQMVPWLAEIAKPERRAVNAIEAAMRYRPGGLCRRRDGL